MYNLKWENDLKMYMNTFSGFILEGNINDLQPVENGDGFSYHPLDKAIAEMYSEDYCVVFFDHTKQSGKELPDASQNDDDDDADSDDNQTCMVDETWFNSFVFYKNTIFSSTGEKIPSPNIELFMEYYRKEYLDNVKEKDTKDMQGAIYIDMIHVSGNYRKAVSAYTDFLNKLSRDVIINNKEYLMIAIRKIHNSMFFVPVETLIKEAMTLVDCISGTPFKKEYNELLFLLGGNLAVLNGDMALADEWVTKSFNFAIENNFKDYEARAARKLIDIYCSKKEYTQALEFSKRYISPEAKIESRYEIYLLGAIGEVYRHLGNFDQALSCYQRMYGITLEKGIMGWVAHAFLGQAAVYLEMGLLDNAQEMLNKAKETYDSISQIWGQINAGIVSQLLDAASGKIRGYNDGLISLSETVQYRYCTEFLRNIDKLSITDLHLYFL